MDNTNSPQNDNQKTTPAFVNSLLGGLNNVKNNAQAETVGGIDRASFELFISSLAGTNDLTHAEGIEFIESQLKLITENTPVLDNLNRAYTELQNYHLVIQEDLLQTSNRDARERRKSLWLFKSKAFTATVLSLPKDLLQGEVNIEGIKNVYLGQRIINEENLETISTEAIAPVFSEISNKDALLKESVLKSLRLSTPKDVQFKRVVLANLKRLQKYPMASNLGGIPYESFSFLVKKLAGNPDLKLGNPGGLKEAIAIINKLDTNSQALKTTTSIYEMLKRHSHATRLKLQTPEGQDLNPYQQEVALKYMPEQVFLASILTQLPDEVAADTVFQDHVEHELKDYDIASDKQHEKSVTEKVARALKKSGKTVAQDQLTKVAKNTSKSISKTIPKGIGFGEYALALTLALSNQLPRDQESFSGESMKNLSTSGDEMSDEANFSVFGMGFGGILGVTKFGKEKPAPQGDEEAFIRAEEEQEQMAKNTTSQTLHEEEIKERQSPVIKPAPISRSLHRGFFANTGMKIKKGISSLVKGLATTLLPTGWIGKIGGLLGGLLGKGVGQKEGAPLSGESNELRNIGIFVALLLGIIGVIIFGGNDKKAAAFVTEISGCGPDKGGSNVLPFGENVCPTTPYIIAQNSSPTVIPETEVTPGQNRPPSSGSNILPQGFPITSSCVTQGPGGSFSHSHPDLNAIDLVVLGNSPNDWIVRTTHDGVISFVGCINSCTKGYGYAAFIQSVDNQYITIYGHMQLNSIRVKVGDFVSQGQPIGVVNDTGFSTANHLHYELRAEAGTQNYEMFGRVKTILNFLPPSSTWQCNL